MTRTTTRITVGGLGALISTLALVAPASAGQPTTGDPGTSTTTQEQQRSAAMRSAAVEDGAQDDYVAAAGPAAQRVRDDFDIPASVTAAQSILESNWGRSTLSVNDRNYFGFKCTSPTNPGPFAKGCAPYPTTECVPAPCHTVNAYFRSYDSMENSFRDYGRLLTTSSTYSSALPYRHDPAAFIREVGRHYATDPSYADKVISLMNTYDLYRFDSGTAPGATLGDESIAASASYRYGTQEHMFSRGADGSLLHSYNAGESIESESYPGALAGEPVAFVAGDTQHVFARLTDNTIGHWYWYPTDADPNFEQWGADDIAGNPTGYAFGDQQHIFARGTDGKLKHLYWTPDTGMVEETQTQSVAGDPVAYVWGDQQHVFGRTTDGHLAHWYWTPTDADPNYGTWGSSTLAGDPTGYAFGEQQHVFARGTDGTLKHFYWTPDEEVVDEPLGAAIQGNPVAYVWNDQQHVFARTPDNQLGHWYWTPEDNQPRHDNWGGNLGANPTGFATDNQENIYGRSTNGTLTHWYWNTDMGAPDIENWGQ
ncbi:glucosaminidase domain-containing protein [Amycolatopsis sp. FBCC-B4732]|uniref:glucosaminidase domain-containing protein n=1 Tax=Amycolatopsis sp. FBCC-B4732 TaxID=3079339 RepID=UPI001FF58D83|nr:glucosaminidase domain-containing protein [Amycolatopsis sp. FBCC-B4732]UOX87677.1 glucosaminidase domain-containing protein [Amycolatopsis sp. FBCC-B4732]